MEKIENLKETGFCRLGEKVLSNNDLTDMLFRAELRYRILSIVHSLADDSLYTKNDAIDSLLDLISTMD